MQEQEMLSGTLTFLFTDIVNSTQLWESAPEAMKIALSRHDELLVQVVQDHSGQVVKTTGDGIHAAFATALHAISAALAAQRNLAQLPIYSDGTGNDVRILVRMGLHTGETELRNGDYFGSAVNRAARLMSIGNGGQVLLSAVTASLVEGLLPPGCELRPLGEYRLRGLSHPEQVVQLVIPGLPDEFPPLHADTAARGNLPVPLTSFVGRERESSELKQLLGRNRLVTILGPGGTGKTRLSIQVGLAVQADFSHGSWLAELAPLTDPEQVLSAVGALWSLRPNEFGTLENQLADYLRGKELLLILDNCEHLVSACADLAAGLLYEAPRVTILASSREGLGVAGESTYHLTTLQTPSRTVTTATDLKTYEAVQLFVQRAQSVRDSFALTEQNARFVAQIVRRLDGIPLAIELAAARSAVLAPEQLAARLDDRFKILTGGSRTALPRQQTLRALIDWSYDLLDEDEQWFFRQLGVFIGGWSLEAAEAIISAERQDLDALDLLSNLVNKSLVNTLDEGGMTRFGFLETIRQYARDKLFEARETSAARQRHLDFFARQIIDFAPITTHMNTGMTVWGLGDTRLPDWTEAMLPDFDNIRRALEWAINTDPDLGLALAVDMAAVFSYHGNYDDNVISLRSALAATESLPERDADADSTRHWLQLNALILICASLVSLGSNFEAIEVRTQAVERARELGKVYEPALASAILIGIGPGIFLGKSGLEVDANEALEIFNRLGSRSATFMPVAVLARHSLMSGNMAAANVLLDEALEIVSELDSAFWLGLAAMSVSKLSLAMGRPDDARALLEQSRQKFQVQGYPILSLAVASDLGHLARKQGEFSKAEALYRQTIPQWLEYGHRPGLANQLECFAFLAVHRGLLERAARLFGAAESLRDESGTPMTLDERDEYDVELNTLKARLDPIAFETAWNSGRALDMTAAVDLAISD